jgi:nitrite reductase/ring-hydroxylating ferredoxin subunit
MMDTRQRAKNDVPSFAFRPLRTLHCAVPASRPDSTEHVRTLSICHDSGVAGVSTHRLCRVDELPRSEGRGFALPVGSGETRVFVIRHEGQPRAYLNRCPHTGVNLDWVPDRFLDWTGRMVQCATHGALFRIEDGYCIAGPCAGLALAALPLREVDGFIEVQLPEPETPR